MPEQPRPGWTFSLRFLFLLILASSLIFLVWRYELRRFGGWFSVRQLLGQLVLDAFVMVHIFTFVGMRGRGDKLAFFVPLAYPTLDIIDRMLGLPSTQDEISAWWLAVAIADVAVVLIGTPVNVIRFIACRKWRDGPGQIAVYTTSVLAASVPCYWVIRAFIRGFM